MTNALNHLHEMEDRLAILICESGCTVGHEALPLCATNDRAEISLWALAKNTRWGGTLRGVWKQKARMKPRRSEDLNKQWRGQTQEEVRI